MYYNCGTAITKRQTKLKPHFVIQCLLSQACKNWLWCSLTFPWPLCNSLTFPGFSGEWSPWPLLWLTEVLHPTRHKIGHFGDVLPKQSLVTVLKKLNLTQHKCSAIADIGNHWATIDMDRKLGGCAPLGEGAGSPSNTIWAGLRLTSVPNGILIHPAVHITLIPSLMSIFKMNLD